MGEQKYDYQAVARQMLEYTPFMQTEKDLVEQAQRAAEKIYDAWKTKGGLFDVAGKKIRTTAQNDPICSGKTLLSIGAKTEAIKNNIESSKSEILDKKISNRQAAIQQCLNYISPPRDAMALSNAIDQYNQLLLQLYFLVEAGFLSANLVNWISQIKLKTVESTHKLCLFYNVSLKEPECVKHLSETSILSGKFTTDIGLCEYLRYAIPATNNNTKAKINALLALKIPADKVFDTTMKDTAISNENFRVIVAKVIPTLSIGASHVLPLQKRLGEHIQFTSGLKKNPEFSKQATIELQRIRMFQKMNSGKQIATESLISLVGKFDELISPIMGKSSIDSLDMSMLIGYAQYCYDVIFFQPQLKHEKKAQIFDKPQDCLQKVRTELASKAPKGEKQEAAHQTFTISVERLTESFNKVADA
ncbi:MAG: hypothetical protein HQM14_11330 [SAR324 cluster bacterium]|nr:hypothetical protein [SAR324 cluster bacterium]